MAARAKKKKQRALDLRDSVAVLSLGAGGREREKKRTLPTEAVGGRRPRRRGYEPRRRTRAAASPPPRRPAGEGTKASRDMCVPPQQRVRSAANRRERRDSSRVDASAAPAATEAAASRRVRQEQRHGPSRRCVHRQALPRAGEAANARAGATGAPLREPINRGGAAVGAADARLTDTAATRGTRAPPPKNDRDRLQEECKIKD